MLRVLCALCGFEKLHIELKDIAYAWIYFVNFILERYALRYLPGVRKMYTKNTLLKTHEVVISSKGFVEAEAEKSIKNRFLFLFCLLTSILFFLAAASNTAISATYYYLDAVNGNDANPGTSEAPWRTMPRAMQNYSGSPRVALGDIVIMRDGHYGDVDFAYFYSASVPQPTSWNDKITYKAETGHSPAFSQLTIRSDSTRYRYFEFDGISISVTTPYVDYAVSSLYAKSLRFKNMKITGNAQYVPRTIRGGLTSYVMHIRTDFGTSDILIENCEISNGNTGIQFTGTAVETPIIIRNNHIHDVSGHGIALCVRTGEKIIVENNYIHTFPHVLDYQVFECSNDIQVTDEKKIEWNMKEKLVQDVTGAEGFFGRWYTDINHIMVYPTTDTPWEVGYTIRGVNIPLVCEPVELTRQDWSHQVGIAIRADNMEIRNNLLHGIVWTAIHTFPGETYEPLVSNGYCNLLIENNLTYDCEIPVLLEDIGTNVTIGNNTFIGYRDPSYPTGSRNGYYYRLPVRLTLKSGRDGLGIRLYNNIIVGALQLGTDVINYEEDNNLIYSVLQDDWESSLKGTHTIIYSDGSNEPKIFDTDFFVNPDYTYEHGLVCDYRLKSGAPAIGFADPAYATSSDILGVSRDSSPDAGCYEYVPSDPNIQTYSITTSAGTGGQISPSGTTLVVSGGSQAYTITANSGYQIANVVVDGSSVGAVSSHTFTNVTANHTIAATFAINTYTLTVNTANGSVTKSPDQASYNYGTQVTLTATPNTGYTFTGWSGDLTGTTNPATITMDGNKTVTATFAINTYTLTVNTSNGSVIKSPNQTSYNYGTQVTLTATPNTGYSFTGWSGDLTGTANPATITMNSNKTVTATFAVDETDETAPTVSNLSPQADSIQVALNTLVTLNIADAGDGINADTVIIKVNNNTIYTGDTAKYSSVYGNCYRTGTNANYRFIYQSEQNFDFDQTINVTVNASDLAGNAMAEYSYSFTTEMRAFGDNKKVNPITLTGNGKPVTVRDSSGNIWAAWHSGTTANKDIYISKLTAGAEAFGDSTKLTNSAADQRNPAIALGNDDKLYVAWQDNRNGNWDIYISTSSDGINWSAETKVTDSNDTQINPAIAVDSSLPNKVYIAWEDSRNGNQDIFVGVSSNGFVSTTVSQITSDLAFQGEPAIAVDSANTVYVVWTDRRITGKNDIYGAASNNSWTNIPVVTADDSQSSPAIATEASGTILHLVWVDDRGGDDDIYYAQTSSGLPTSPLTGSSIIDEPGADQKQPTIAVTGTTGNNLHVFACWQDERWVDSIGDTDLFFVEITSGSGDNIFVGDERTNTDQSEPAIAIDQDGYPYLVWTNDNIDIYYAGSTFIEPDVLASEEVNISVDTLVGTNPIFINSVDDVSVVIPAGAYPCDIEITISKINNPLAFNLPCLGAYDFGPSNIEFTVPVTITIPYSFTGTEDVALAYWYNSLTDELSQQGITDVTTIIISSTVHALRFKTTHFTPFYIFLGSAAASSAAGGGGGGGGGCMMSADSQASAVELLLPYVGLTAAMAALKLRDRRKRARRNITKSGC